MWGRFSEAFRTVQPNIREVCRVLYLAPTAHQQIQQLNDVLFRGIKLVGTLALLGHFFGCFWSFVSLSAMDEEDDSAPRTWWESLGLQEEDLTGRYIASIYWAFTTMTTVG